MNQETISRADARRVYNQLGRKLDHADRQEGRAKAAALALLGLAAGQQVLQVSVGTGGEQATISQAVAPGGTVVGLDLARGLLELTRQRADTPLCEGDAAALPFAAASFDRLFSAYMLDLLSMRDIPQVLAEFRRVLRPGGRLALVSLTEGVDVASRLFVASWKLGYQLDRERYGGCRPMELSRLVVQAGFGLEQRSVVVQRGFPSEIVVAVRGVHP